MKKVLFYPAVALTMATAVAVQGAEQKPAMPARPAPVVSVSKATGVESNAAREFIGLLEALEEVDLQARISGLVEKNSFSEGGLVKAGDLLIEIEDTTYVAQVEQARAALAQAEAELEYAEKIYTRNKQLVATKAISDSVMDESVRNVATGKAKVAAAKATLLDAENNLSYTKVYAPISGRIGKAAYTPGNYVSLSSEPLASIVRVDKVYVKFSISERDFLKFGTREGLRERAQMKVTLADGQVYEEPGVVEFIDNKVDPATGTVSIWAVFENKAGKLTPGGYVTIALSEKNTEPAVGIPQTAVLIDRKGAYVYVLGDENKAIRRGIETGDVVGNLMTVKSGLKLGEVVISDGTHKVIPGAPVKVEALK